MPFIVLAIIKLELSFLKGICLKTVSNSRREFPSTSFTINPKASNLSIKGSMGFTSSVFPVICNLFLSMIIIRLSSLYLLAEVKASQTDP